MSKSKLPHKDEERLDKQLSFETTGNKLPPSKKTFTCCKIKLNSKPGAAPVYKNI